ncbi:hypothetical protein MPDQ_001194 [Monascus purpureus]|uniref:rRNA methyltransferase 1, mitochondrial n=1 Tax=Monascus purpureus TaxID=5098 RepID=A0A507R0U1_MONPU|nr:hypothetical protein MPDQ_001194 [Monascus purpureus]BDD61409.1 hypothetical protein MAP00_006453 [Monascus purpureus]
MSVPSTLAGARICRQILAPKISVRHASLTSAIERGIRKSRSLESSTSPSDSSSGRGFRPNRSSLRSGKPEHSDRNTRSESSEGPRPFKIRPRKNRRGPRTHKFSDEAPEHVKTFVKCPESMPLTHPASEFIYGTNAVEAALRCSRRKLYKLYIYQGADELLGFQKIALRKLALVKGVPVKMAFGEWDRLLDKVCEGRPHNGCVLEASPLPLLPVRSFHGVADPPDDFFRMELAPQSREEAAVNGTNNRIPILRSSQWKQNRYPVALLLDGILDPGNLGAIVRSAYYLGIDAVLFAGRNSAPLSPVAIKSSAGAAENMTLLKVNNEVEFIKQSKANGWRFYAADAPGLGTTYVDPHPSNDSNDHTASPLTQSPSVLMLGSEGTGLSNHIKNHADAIVSIPWVRNPVPGVASDPARVDSLNVSVAAALLMEKFLLVPVEISSAIPRMPQEKIDKQRERNGNKQEKGSK